MLSFFKHKKKFAILFFLVLLIDLAVKTNLPIYPYRYLSLPPVIILLILYYYYNRAPSEIRGYSWSMLSLFCFLIADVLIIDNSSIYILVATLIAYTLAKVFLIFRFSHQSDFNVTRLMFFSAVIFIYTALLVIFVYDELGNLFFPMIITFFTSLLLCQFAYLRKGVVDRKSYLLVFIGVVFYMISEGIMVVKTIKSDVPFQNFSIMFFYALGLYLIVNGIIIEKKVEPKSVF